jgi:hypothetical protein
MNTQHAPMISDALIHLFFSMGGYSGHRLKTDPK